MRYRCFCRQRAIGSVLSWVLFVCVYRTATRLGFMRLVHTDFFFFFFSENLVTWRAQRARRVGRCSWVSSAAAGNGHKGSTHRTKRPTLRIEVEVSLYSRQANGQSHERTEHLEQVVADESKAQWRVRRSWTSVRFCDDMGVWELPAEKCRGVFRGKARSEMKRKVLCMQYNTALR